MSDHKFSPGDVIATDQCECCGADVEIKLDKNLNAYLRCSNMVPLPLSEFSEKDRKRAFQPKKACNRRVWFSRKETADLKRTFLIHLKEIEE